MFVRRQPWLPKELKEFNCARRICVSDDVGSKRKAVCRSEGNFSIYVIELTAKNRTKRKGKFGGATVKSEALLCFPFSE